MSGDKTGTGPGGSSKLSETRKAKKTKKAKSKKKNA